MRRLSLFPLVAALTLYESARPERARSEPSPNRHKETSTYKPHQGSREIERRRRKIEKMKGETP